MYYQLIIIIPEEYEDAKCQHQCYEWQRIPHCVHDPNMPVVLLQIKKQNKTLNNSCLFNKRRLHFSFSCNNNRSSNALQQNSKCSSLSSHTECGPQGDDSWGQRSKTHTCSTYKLVIVFSDDDFSIKIYASTHYIHSSVLNLSISNLRSHKAYVRHK